jgi:hypothetical protein
LLIRYGVNPTQHDAIVVSNVRDRLDHRAVELLLSELYEGLL